uniref:Uncharacterized protein n=1 Tax=Rhizophora mucronata TaxID=61149 RepID=A0A2P2N8M8_RHIMU
MKNHRLQILNFSRSASSFSFFSLTFLIRSISFQTGREDETSFFLQSALLSVARTGF